MRSLPTLLIALSLSTGAYAQALRDVVITTTPVAGRVFMLEGQGGNIGLCVGEDGAFLIDDQFAPLTGRILAAVAAQTEEPVRFVINTHWHFDHTGGNEALGEEGALIVAHENVRARMSTDQFMEAFGRAVPAAPPAALPVVTFTDSVTFHWNDETIHVFHVAPAHTDGDSMVHFKTANVLHTGDVFFNGMYPFIDASSGGSIDGVIAAVERVLPLMNQDTKVIPGHGALSNPDELRDYLAMLRTVRDRMRPMIDRGLSRDEIITATPTTDLDERWGGGFMKPDDWVGIVYDGMKKE